jgi:hypothetical protein
VRDGDGWVAFTTDLGRPDLAWVVRWHPEHGRSVLLVRDEEAASIHTLLQGPTLLLRVGGYWWDGVTWYRPNQVWDAASEEYVRRVVPGAVTVSAHDLLAHSGDPQRGHLLRVADINPDLVAPPQRWQDELALWASRRDDDPMDLSRCVVRVTAPELTADQLVGAGEMAEIAGVSSSTLRAYVSRGESDVPQPQASINGRNVWARPVAEEWAESRRRSSDSVSSVLATHRYGVDGLAPGVAHVWEKFTNDFFSRLWENPDRRKQWALRWRNETAVRELARDLSWSAAADITHCVVPIDALSATIRHAFLNEFADGQRRRHELNEGPEEQFFGVEPGVARILHWLVRFSPETARHTIGEIVGEAERQLELPRHVSEESVRSALHVDGQLEAESLDEFLDRVLTPAPRAGA